MFHLIFVTKRNSTETKKVLHSLKSQQVIAQALGIAQMAIVEPILVILSVVHPTELAVLMRVGKLYRNTQVINN
jgi:hypothetical protein